MPESAHRDSVQEEIFSSITHGLGAIVGAGALLYFFFKADKLFLVKSLTLILFGFSFLFLFLFSTLFHSLSFTKARKVFQILDHSAIYVFIAATYTPFLLLVVGGPIGWIIFASLWVITILGVIYKSLFLGKFSKLSLTLYLAMVCCAILVIGPLALGLSPVGLTLLIAGGLFYTFGAMIYSWRSLKFNHGLWHLFVLAGSLCHLFSLLTI